MQFDFGWMSGSPPLAVGWLAAGNPLVQRWVLSLTVGQRLFCAWPLLPWYGRLPLMISASPMSLISNSLLALVLQNQCDLGRP